MFVLLAAPAFAADPPKTEEQKTLYALGVLLNRSVASFQLSPAELESVKQGLTDAGTGKAPAVDMQVYGPKVQELAKARRKAQAEKLASAGKAFEEKAAKEKGAVKTASGLVYLSLKEGTGKSPGPTSTVKVNYRGTLPDGKEFDSSYKRGTPAEFSAERGHQVLQRGAAEDEGGRQGEAGLPVEDRLRGPGSGGRHPSGRDPHVRDRASRNQGVG